jgi:hypothetical protein
MIETTAIPAGRTIQVNAMSPAHGSVSTGRSAAFDRDLAAQAEGRLRTSGHPALQCLVCECRARILVLRGRVSSYYLKQLAQELVRRIDGTEAIVNLVDVGSDAS